MNHVRTSPPSGGRQSILLKLAYAAIILLLVGIIFHFVQLLRATEKKTLHQVEAQTRSGAARFQRMVRRLESTGQNLAVHFVEDHLNRDSGTAERHLIDNLRFLVAEYEDQELEIELLMASGQQFLFQHEAAEGWSVTSQQVPFVHDQLWEFPTWESDGETASFIQPLRIFRSIEGNLILRIRLEGLFAGSAQQHEGSALRNWWLGPRGDPVQAAALPGNSENQILLEDLRHMMWERREGITTQDCPWHGNHKTYTSLSPVRLGNMDLAVLSTIDTGYVRTPF